MYLKKTLTFGLMSDDHKDLTWTKTYDSPEEAAEWILSKCNQTKIMCFTGELGAGKTTTIQYICRQLGYHGEVTSPTYAIINEYLADGAMIYHMDLYRIEDIDQAIEIGIDEYLYDIKAYCLIEWPALVKDYFEIDRYDIIIKRVNIDSPTREITVTFVPM